jgi:hypothetical protein
MSLGELSQGSVAYRPGASLGGGELTPAERDSGITTDGLLVGGGSVEGWATDSVVAKHKHADVWSTGQGTRGMIIRMPGRNP